MSPRCFIPTTTLILALAGCDEHRYEITMRQADDGAVTRELRYSVHESGSIMPKKLDAPEHLLEIYGLSAAKTATSHTFSRSIRDSIPGDLRIGAVANFGSTTTSASPLGTVHSYRERAPGPTRPWSMVKGFERVIDLAIRAWVGYAAKTPELQAAPEKLRKLEAFLCGTMHDDAMDLALIVWHEWLFQSRAKSLRRLPEFEQELAARAAVFLQERGYLDERTAAMSDPLVVMSAFEGLLRRIHLELGGAPEEPLAPALAKLIDPNEMSSAFKAGLAAIGMTEKDFEQTLHEAFAFSLFGNTLTAKIRWVGRPQPVESNGKWNADTRELTWETGAVDAPLLPDILYAIWALPNEAEQQKRFGANLLRSNLPQYNDWYQTLSASQRADWDEFIAGLTPESDTERQLRRYVSRHESSDASQEKPDGSRLSYGATLLLDEISRERKAKSQGE